jgi:hypothetical protein
LSFGIWIETMNRQNESLMGARLERLVDGELSPEEYRSLLASLEEEPGLWRQCALAFLEAQALRHELGDVRRHLDARENRPVTGDAVPRTSTAWDKVQILLAVAASFLVAFTLGLAVPKIYPLLQEGAGGGNMNGQSPVVLTDGRDSEEAPHEAVRYVGDVRLLVNGSADGSEEAGRVPVYEVGRDVAQFLTGEASALGPEMLELLRQNGFEVRHDQQYFPAPLEDGRQIIVPVEGFQITPVSRRF